MDGSLLTQVTAALQRLRNLHTLVLSIPEVAAIAEQVPIWGALRRMLLLRTLCVNLSNLADLFFWNWCT